MIFKILVLLQMCAILRSLQLKYPIGFGIVRIVDPSLTYEQYIQKISVPTSDDNLKGYNMVSLDGFKHDSTFSNLDLYPTPITIWKNVYQIIEGNKPNIHGNSNLIIQNKILDAFHSKGSKLLMNVRLDEAPVSSQKLSVSTIGNSIVTAVNQLKLDGVSMQFLDYHAVYENTASDWLTELLWYIRKNTENENLITVLIIPPTYVTAMKMFRQNSVNSLVDYYVLKYYDTKQDDYTDGNKVFQQSSFYEGTALFQIMKNNEINIDICRTIVSKPVLMSGSWNRRQYIGKESLKGSFMQVYNKYGWFGGYGNLDMTSDVGNMFVDDVLGEVRKQCLRFQTCVC